MKKIFILIVLSNVLFSIHKLNAQCQANFTVYPDTTLGAPLHTYIGENLCQGANFLGIDTINYTYTWTWGDGTSTTAPFPSHTYATTGNYTICVYMNATNPAGCDDTLCINATINKNAAMATINFKKPGVASNVNNTLEGEFNIYPNPTNGLLNIVGLLQNSHIYIYNVDGKILFNQIVNDSTIQLTHFAKGIYAIKISMPNGKSIVRKIVVE